MEKTFTLTHAQFCDLLHSLETAMEAQARYQAKFSLAATQSLVAEIMRQANQSGETVSK